MKIKAIIFIVCCAFISCNSSKNPAEEAAKMQVLDQLMAQNDFQIESNWAHPLVSNSITSIANSRLLPPGSTAGAIDIFGNPNYLRVMGDSISMYLPYYGERQLAATYNNTIIAIKYDGKPDNIKIEKNEKKQTYELQFIAKGDRETYRVFIKLTPNLTSMISVNSSHRTPISYKGNISKIPKNDQPITVQ
ncbi:DUF4251 domain-containing protein [Aquimarina gracilis]|uniref:DUF4251 domain-containing protein n=1 Tax=Aquimarina gracilis TaxID=874422 RepID=A0ABU5ZX17_9FLAO|nr:DUF4251 domain-containing protein [Aquimarina gracilis]MEB3346414.1 DUF4251 domain-containing protein [Aquimarina gracilis]